jgi:hypothetical protein
MTLLRVAQQLIALEVARGRIRAEQALLSLAVAAVGGLVGVIALTTCVVVALFALVGVFHEGLGWPRWAARALVGFGLPLLGVLGMKFALRRRDMNKARDILQQRTAERRAHEELQRSKQESEVGA